MPWPAETRERALAIYLTDGPTMAARETGVPRPTVTYWARRDGLPATYANADRYGIVERHGRWLDRQLEFAEDVALAAEATLARYMEDLPDGDPTALRNLAVSVGILVDKAQLTSGAATSRAEAAVVYQTAEQRFAAAQKYITLARSRDAVPEEATVAKRLSLPASPDTAA